MGHQSMDGLKITEPLDHQVRYQFRLGDLTWVNTGGSSWWPAQVVDEDSVGIKPTKNQKTDCLVRLYGTYDHMYVDPSECSSEFECMLKQENKSTMEEFQKILAHDLSRIKSGDQSKDTGFESTGDVAAETTTNEQKRQKGADRSRARPSAGANSIKSKTIQLREKYDTRNQVSRQEKPGTDGRRLMEPENAHSEHTIVQTLKQGKSNMHNTVKMPRTGTSITKNIKKEGVRRSIRIKLNEQITEEASRDEVSLRNTSIEPEKVDQGNTTHKEGGDGTLRAHNQKKDDGKVKDGHIRAMIRDILFKGKIPELGEAEGPNAKQKLNGTVAAPDAKQEGSRKRKSTESSRNKGKGVVQRAYSAILRCRTAKKEDSTCVESNNIKERVDAKANDKAFVYKNADQGREAMDGALNSQEQKRATPNAKGQVSHDDAQKHPSTMTPASEIAAEGGQRSDRQVRVMQSLALIAPSGSPYRRNGLGGNTY